jgi:hypothetical protein
VRKDVGAFAHALARPESHRRESANWGHELLRRHPQGLGQGADSGRPGDDLPALDAAQSKTRHPSSLGQALLGFAASGPESNDVLSDHVLGLHRWFLQGLTVKWRDS